MNIWITIIIYIANSNTMAITKINKSNVFCFIQKVAIYIFKKECLDFVTENEFFNATDLIEVILKKGKKIINYPILTYWLDIGKHEDFEKAQEDIKHIKL